LFIVPTRRELHYNLHPADVILIFALTARGSPSELIRNTVAALSQADQTAFYALSYAKPNVSVPDIPFEIFQTNAIAAGSGGTGLFPRTARLNHGCSRAFGAVYSWREAEGVLGEFEFVLGEVAGL
jgi:hypothetical protein